MKTKLIIVFGCACLWGCVSSAKYKSRVGELKKITAECKTIRKEIQRIEKRNVSLLDTISVLVAENNLLSTDINKRLRKNNIHAKIKASDLEGLTIQRSAMTESAYKYYKERYKCIDTNSARNTPWLTAKEKKIYYYFNWARLDPQGFCKKFVLPKLKHDSDDVYLLTLIDYLYEMKPRNALKPDKTQYENAKCHAINSGELGFVGHLRQTKTCTTSFRGECCSYGLSDPLDVVLQLLIDQGVSSIGHRYISLGWYEYAGISMAPHKGYGTNVVLDFK